MGDHYSLPCWDTGRGGLIAGGIETNERRPMTGLIVIVIVGALWALHKAEWEQARKTDDGPATRDGRKRRRRP